MMKYGLMRIDNGHMCLRTYTSEAELEEHYAQEYGYSPVEYKSVKVYIDAEPPTPVVKDVMSDRQVMFLADDGGDPKLFDHMVEAQSCIDREGDLYQHIGRMECVFKPIEEM